MEKYKKDLETRIYLCTFYCVIAVLPNVLLNFFIEYNTFTNFVMVILIASEGVALYHIGKYSIAIKDDNILKRFYIIENDERRIFINNKIGANGLVVVVAILTLVMLVSGYFNQVVFFTLLFVVCLIILVTACFKIYYNKSC